MSFLARFRPSSAIPRGSAKSPWRGAAAALVAILVAGASPAGLAQDKLDVATPDAKDEKISVFELPGLRNQEELAARLLQARRLPDAERVLAQVAVKYPHLVAIRFKLAAIQAVMGKNDAAMENLAGAVEHGFRGAQMLQNEKAFAKLHGDPRFQKLVGDAAKSAAAAAEKSGTKVVPAKVTNGVATVDESNTGWNGRLGALASLFEFESDKPATLSVRAGNGPAVQMLNNLYVVRKAAGNHKDLYDNRDRGHSTLQRVNYPQLTFVEYSAVAKRYGTDYGLNNTLLFNQITFGNSSTAYVGGPFSRSLANVALTRPGGARFLYLQYRANQLYVYPEHKDHDPDRGDVFPVNTPYILISQGSSGSDQPFLDAIASVLAGFKPDTKNFLRQHQLVMPTVQMVLRRGLNFVTDKDTYLDGRAHPTVFDGKDLDIAKMVKLANGLNANEVPPVVLLNVVEESQPRRGIDYFSGGPDERFFDTPSAISRVYRSVGYDRRMVVSAGTTKDPNGRPLTFRWVVLRGDADRIRIKPADQSNSVVELFVPWHERRNVPGREDLTTDRVDIGVFADNGVNLSAPAFISVVFPADQKRQYDAKHRPVSIDYNDPELSKRYVDAYLFPRHDWRDAFEYDDQGRMIGWARTRGGAVGRYTRDGAKVVATDKLGRPTKAQVVIYRVGRTPNQPRALIIETPIKKYLTYSYANAKDRYGVMSAP